MILKEYILHWQEVYDKNQSRPTTYAAHGYLFKNHILPMEVVDNASDENNENTRRKATVVPIKIEYV